MHCIPAAGPGPRRCALLLAALTILGLSMSGCATPRRPPPALATIPGIAGHFGIGRIIELGTGQTLDFDQLVLRLASKDLVFVGEVHDNPEHHLIQVQILQALAGRCPALNLAMEAFEKPKQAALDRYLTGETEEETFLQETDWKESWGYDYHLYRPLLLAARQAGLGVMAVNAPRAIIKKVARVGLDGLNPGERGQLAQEIDLGNEAHRAFLSRAYGRHDHPALQEFEYFYEAQCAWEDTMAHNISASLEKTGIKTVVFTGNGHITRKFGIPDRTRSRVSASMATVVLYPLNGPETLDRETADFIWLTPLFPRRAGAFHGMKGKPCTPSPNSDSARSAGAG